MKKQIILTTAIVFVGLFTSCNENPNDIGMHWDYSIICENGFKYKVLGHRGTILMLDDEGKPMKCNCR